MLSRSSFHRVAMPLAAALISAMAAAPALAARDVHVGEVHTVATESSAAFEEAMRTALVRITGQPDADQDPAFADLISNARRYVQILDPASNPPGVMVKLDAAAIERAVVAAGRHVWPRERPLVLMALAQTPTDFDQGAARQALEQAASLRGLPVSVSDAPDSLLADPQLARDAALAAARAQGADAALIGRAQSEGNWHWTFFGPANVAYFDGSLDSGIQGAATALANHTERVLALPPAAVSVQINGVSTLRDYAAVSGILGGLSGVRSVAMSEAGTNSATFHVSLSGGGDGLLALLAGNAHLHAVSADAGTLAFQYQP